jgi:transposase-like protein
MSQNVPNSGDDLNPNQELAIMALLSSTSLQSVARAAGVDRRTLFRWLQEPNFVRAYRAARRECVAQAIAQVQREASGAVSVLVDVAKGREKPGRNTAAARVSAAKAILDLAFRSIEIEDMWTRLEEMERTGGNDEKTKSTS